MKKFYLFGFGLFVLAGLAMIGLGMMYSVQSAPTEANVISPPAPAAVAGDTLAVADLSTRDAMFTADDAVLPVDSSSASFSSELAAIHRDDMMGDDMAMALDAAVPPAAPAPSAALSPDNWFHHRHEVRFVWHRVRRGETLSGIAERFDTSVWRLARLNGIRCVHRIIAGRWILVPA